MQKLKFSRFSGTFITNAILIVLFIVFILETIMGGSTNINTLLRLGAMNNQLVTVEHQWWRGCLLLNFYTLDGYILLLTL